jgi:hypothetical protein
VSLTVTDYYGAVNYSSVVGQITVTSSTPPPPPPTILALLEQYWWAVLIGIVVIVAIGGAAGASHKKKRAARQETPGETTKAKGKKGSETKTTSKQPALTQEQVYANLKHLFVFHKETGACLLYRPFTEAKFDPQLIAGFLSAISSFGGQFDEGAKLKTLEYHSFKILLEETKYLRHALLFQGNLDETLNHELKAFIIEFESVYKNHIANFRGELSYFKDAPSIIEKIFVPASKKVAESKISQEIGHVFHLYCPTCQKWFMQAPDAMVWGNETCETCNSPLSFVPRCARCGNSFTRPVEEYNAFKKSSPLCDKCGAPLYIQ